MTQPWDPNTGGQPEQPSGYPTSAQPGGGYHPTPAEQPGQAGAPGYYQQPGYPTAGYQQPGYPQPGYQQPGYQQPGYPPPGYPGYPGYPGVPTGPTRPGAVTAAAVLAFVQGGIVIISGIVLLSVVNEFSRRVDGFAGNKAEAWAVTIAVLVAGALLIAGGVQLIKGPTGAAVIGSALSLLISVYFLIRSEFNSGVVWLALSYAVLPIIILAFALGAGARSWAARPR
jgi:hypothetical protein